MQEKEQREVGMERDYDLKQYVLNVLFLQILYIWTFKYPFSLSIIHLMVNHC